MRRINFYIILLLFIAGCRDRYDIPLRETDQSQLVVEGVLNAGAGSTTITLSRTVKLNDTVRFKPEARATLTVEEKDGQHFSLTESGSGTYTHAHLPMVFGKEYRLRIRTSNNKEYLSDFVVAKQTPPVDSITWRKETDGMHIFTNTHDPSNNTRYYRWEFDETWEILSFYPASYKWEGGTTIVRYPSFNNRCWKYLKSNKILIGTTVQLQDDVVSQEPLQFISPDAEQLGVRYSILVKQQTLTKEAYEYLKLMKKNTESIGTVFDPQPVELKGNIHCVTTPEEGVIGYLTASSFSEKRLFITAQEAGWKYPEVCPYIRITNDPESINLWMPTYLPFEAERFFGQTVAYLIAPARCVDCTKRGGDLNRPAYW